MVNLKSAAAQAPRTFRRIDVKRVKHAYVLRVKPTLTVRHRLDLDGFRNLLITGPPRTPPAHLRLEQGVDQS